MTTRSPGRTSPLDDDEIAGGAVDLDRLRDRRAVGLDHEHEAALLPDDDGRGRHDERVLIDEEPKPDVHEPARPERAIGVGKAGLEQDGTGRGVDRVVDEGQGALARSAPADRVGAAPRSVCARYFWIAGRLDAGTANRARIGWIWLIVTSGSASVERTRLPSRTRRLPVRPAIGARIVAYWRLSRAWSTAAWLDATVADAAAAVVRTASFCCAVTYSFRPARRTASRPARRSGPSPGRG